MSKEPYTTAQFDAKPPTGTPESATAATDLAAKLIQAQPQPTSSEVILLNKIALETGQ